MDSKGDFCYALLLRYDWSFPNPRHCGKSYSVDHAMICPTGGFPTIHHNEICDLTASLLTEVCHNVSVEPPLNGENFFHRTANMDDGAHAKDAFFNVRVFYPNASSSVPFCISVLHLP